MFKCLSLGALALLLVSMGAMAEVAIIGHELVEIVEDGSAHKTINMTTFTCTNGDNYTWTYNGEKLDFQCGYVEYTFVAQRR